MNDSDSDSGTERITVSLPKGTKAALQAAVEAGVAPNVSALVSQAVEVRLRRESFHQKIMALHGDRPWDQDALDWAYRSLGATPEQIAAIQTKLGMPPQTGEMKHLAS